MSQKRIYSDYPREYAYITRKLEEEKKPFSLKLPWREAASFRRDYYRFRIALGEADINDRTAKKLHNVARNVTIRLNPSVGTGEDPTEVTVVAKTILGGIDMGEVEEKEGPLIDLGDIGNYLED